MARHEKTERLIEAAVEILAAHSPMTVRQVYYQLVSLQVVENNRWRYQAVCKALVGARQDRTIPWERIEDRTRRPRHVSMWTGLKDFAELCRESYRRDVWATQARRVECWLEKDALSGIFEAELEPYGVTLNVGRGYDGWSSIHNAGVRFADGKDVTVLYFGDFDPSGVDMVRSLGERLEFFDCKPEIVKCALTPKDIRRYKLPPDFAKRTDSRTPGFIAKHGDVSVELDALPVDVLQRRIVQEVESRMDLDALRKVRRLEKRERKVIAKRLAE